jgi:hypothetical protein
MTVFRRTQRQDSGILYQDWVTKIWNKPTVISNRKPCFKGNEINFIEETEIDEISLYHLRIKVLKYWEVVQYIPERYHIKGE